MKTKKITTDKDAQVIILAGFIIGLSILALSTMINQIAYSGYHASKAELDEAKYMVNALRAETIRTIERMASISWQEEYNRTMPSIPNFSNVTTNFERKMSNYSMQIPRFYLQYGKAVNISNFKVPGYYSNNRIKNVSFTMSYSDGINSYTSTLLLDNIGVVQGPLGELGSHKRKVLIAYAKNFTGSNETRLIYAKVTDELGNPIPNGVNETGVKIPITFTPYNNGQYGNITYAGIGIDGNYTNLGPPGTNGNVSLIADENGEILGVYFIPKAKALSPKIAVVVSSEGLTPVDVLMVIN